MTDHKPTQEMTTTDAKPPRERRVSPRIAEVVRLLLTGECKTQRAAAKRVGMNASHVSEQLKKPHVQGFIARKTRETLANGTLRASARLLELIDADSEHVAFDASKHVLGIAGIKPADHAQVSVNVDVKAGFIIDLSEPPKQVRTIDATAAAPGSARTIEHAPDPTVFQKPRKW
jgi:hypothetical protein